MAHLEGEATGMYLLGRNGMWHGGIHITDATTPWCALSGKSPAEAADFPVRYRGEQAVRCMADGEVVAYRICRDYLQVPWECGPLSVSGSFVLVRHYVQPGEKAESGLHFYTLYMHLAPWSAYDTDSGTRPWTVCNSLSAYAPEWLLGAGADSQSVNDAYRVATMPAGTRVAWDDSDISLSITSRGRRYGLVTFRGLSAEESQGNTRLQPGQQYWVLVDHDNLAPAAGEATRPAWWSPLLPPFRQTLQFDRVVCPDPYPVKAGDAVGHLGYFQTPKEGGHDARYQVHIECLSMDENLETFLTNPERVGEDSPVWLKCPAGLALYERDVKTGGFSRKSRASEGEAILALSQVKTEQDARKQDWYYLPFAHGYVPVDSQDVEKLSQYDLDRLGFKAITDEATTFDHLDGKTPPAGLVRRIFETLLAAAKADPRVSHRSVPFNYQRLLNKIDRGVTPYSSQEYLSAVHNPSYREARSRLVVKHPSEWYYRKEDALWQGFLNSLLPDAPEWREYSEGFIDRMAWMQDAGRLKLGPLLWHMHPVEFLGTLKSQQISVYRNYTPEDAREALITIYNKHGHDMAKIIEQLYRDETGHFQSTQYKRCGAGGMEIAGANPQPPGYGWNESLFLRHPEYSPIGIWWAFENKGLSGQGGNQQVTTRKKGYIIFPTVLAAMEYKVDYIKRNHGNWARWHSLDVTVQSNYREAILKMRHPYVDEISGVKK